MKAILVLFVLLTFTAIAQAQTTPVVASVDEQARIKPLIDAETKAREALNAKIVALPEAKALKDAQDAVVKAQEALNKAAEKLPENDAWKQASAKVLDLAYRIQAEHKLSSREHRPELDPKGQLVFTKIPKPGN